MNETREAGDRCSRYLLIPLIVIFSALSGAACRQDSDRGRVPTEVQEVIANEVFKTLRAKLGKIESRSLQSAAEQRNSGGPLKGHVFILSYETRFERGDGMENFTLIEENGQWLLARYFVNSTALQ